MKRETVLALIDLMAATSDDCTRRVLQCVNVERDGDNLTLTATDGHILVQRKLVDDSINWGAVTNASVHSDSLPILKMMAKEKHTIPSVTSTDGRHTWLARGGPQLEITHLEYPKYQSVLPQVTEDWIEINFNPELLAALSKAIGKRKNAGLKLRFKTGTNRLGPIDVRPLTNAEELGFSTACIMPMKG